MAAGFTWNLLFDLFEYMQYACPCLSALGVATRAHTHQCAVHCTMQPVCYTLYYTRAQWRSTLSNDTTPALCRWKKTGTIHGTLCPSAPPEGTDLPKLPVRRTGGPQKNCPQKTGGKKGIGGGLDLKAWMKGIFQQNYDRWGLCEACVAQAKVLGPMWLMAELTRHCMFSHVHFSPSLSFNAELALFVAIFQFVGTEGRPFMFRRMTTDLGDKSRFPPFLKASLERLNCQKYF